MMSLFLRTTDKYGKSHGGFQWPLIVGATVTAPDWKAVANCGNGLHGLMNGLGENSHLNFDDTAIWWIIEADSAIDLDGKHKFQTCKIVVFGPRHEITAQLYALCPGPIHGLVLTGGDGSTLTGGDGSTLTGGNRSTLTGGDRSTLTGGNRSTMTGGNRSTMTGGNRSTMTSGDGATMTSGYGSTLTGGYRSTLTGGDRSTLTGGNRSTMTSGYGSTMTGGYGSTMIFIRWIDGYRRILIAYVGENGIKPNVAYRASDDHTTVIEVTKGE